MHVVGMRRERSAPALTCRSVVVQLGKVACGLGLAAALLGPGWIQPTAAQDYGDTGQDSTQVSDDTGQNLGIDTQDAQDFAESCGASR